MRVPIQPSYLPRKPLNLGQLFAFGRVQCLFLRVLFHASRNVPGPEILTTEFPSSRGLGDDLFRACNRLDGGKAEWGTPRTCGERTTTFVKIAD